MMKSLGKLGFRRTLTDATILWLIGKRLGQSAAVDRFFVSFDAVPADQEVHSEPDPKLS